MLENTRLFVKVVQQGSFSKAAALVKTPKSTVSRAVRALEDETGTKLLIRTTRSLSLTAAGRAFYETCVGPLQTIEEAEKSLKGHDTLVAGTIKLTAPEDLGAYVISPALATLSKRHPKLQFEIQYSNDIVDLVKDGYDLAVRIGKLTASRFKVKRMGVITLVLVASPEYLASAPRLDGPADLVGHAALTLNLASVVPRWVLTTGKKTATAGIKPVVICNQMTTLVRMAQAGAGVALVPEYLSRGAVERGELVHVLPEWYQSHYPVSLVSPLSTEKSARVKACADYLIEAVGKALVG